MEKRRFNIWKENKTKSKIKDSEYDVLDDYDELDNDTRDKLLMVLAEKLELVVIRRHTFYGEESIDTEILTKEQWDEIPDGYDCNICHDGERLEKMPSGMLIKGKCKFCS